MTDKLGSSSFPGHEGITLGRPNIKKVQRMTCGHSGEGEGEMHWEIRADINTPSCVKQIASGK